jgi:phenylacetate-CoA ligase
MICTGLLNDDMPLIRYRVGDRGALDDDVSCPCGREMPLVRGIDGRSDDLLYTSDGRTIGRMDPVFKARLPVREAQIVQETFELVRVRYVPAEGFDAADGVELARRIRERLGDIEVELCRVEEIPRTSNGKFRAVICNLKPDERARVATHR